MWVKSRHVNKENQKDKKEMEKTESKNNGTNLVRRRNSPCGIRHPPARHFDRRVPHAPSSLHAGQTLAHTLALIALDESATTAVVDVL